MTKLSFVSCMTALTSMLVLHGAQAAASAGVVPANDYLGGRQKVPALFVFGNSLVDVGTNTFLPNPAFQANFTPYGRTYFHVPTGRFSDGRLWIDFLAQYLDLPLLQAYLNPNTREYTRGVDFASAGSGNFESVKATIARLFGGTIANMDEQLQWFRRVKASLISSHGEIATDTLLGASIFVVNTGSNDLSWGYAQSKMMQQLYTPDEFTSLLIEAMYNTTKVLFDEGAKKIVLGAIGPIGCSPAAVAENNGACVESLNDLAKLFNSKLPGLLEHVNLNFHDVRVIYTDAYSVIEGLIKNGTEQGFSKGSQACCGTGKFNGQPRGCGAVNAHGAPIYNLCPKEDFKEYVFWDDSHPTEKVYGILADLFISGDGVSKPYNISQLVQE